jgi:hypothetical protein
VRLPVDGRVSAVMAELFTVFVPAMTVYGLVLNGLFVMTVM